MKAFGRGNRNNKDAEAKCETLLNKLRELNIPIYHIIHDINVSTTSKLNKKV
ncbi:hypothetical protein [Tenacibaculum ovolyticum]|uniref:hypothetical protein n=1 Tax=Tenacibaculum ovolyticum TaxID=104270 RepID=UPI001F3BEA28|nr:hypothetical protein [Tenacibaculum ovolyticum]